MTQSLDTSAAEGRHFQQAIRRWGNSLALRLPADCLRQAGMEEGDQIEIVAGEDGRLNLMPLRQLGRSALVADLTPASGHHAPHPSDDGAMPRR